jgi:autotransporter passenger strand-loop-strand repeat protein
MGETKQRAHKFGRPDNSRFATSSTPARGKAFSPAVPTRARRSAAAGCCLPTLAQWALVPSSAVGRCERDIAAMINLNGTRLVQLGGFASSATISSGGIQDNRIRRQRGGTVRGRLGGTRASACQQPQRQLASPSSSALSSPSAPSSRCVPASCSPTNTVGAVPLSNCCTGGTDVRATAGSGGILIVAWGGTAVRLTSSSPQPR